jgi:hypothetical protein
VSGAVRTPDELLADLGARLERAWDGDEAAGRGRPGARWGRWRRGSRSRGASWWGGRRARWAIAAVLAAAAAVPTAVATRDSLWAPGLPDLPEQLRPPGEVTPDRAGAAVYVATGHAAGTTWRLSAEACDYGAIRAVGVFLTVPGGGGGARCDVASRVPGPAPSPEALAARRVQSYFDPATQVTWVFGALPARARAVRVGTATAPARPVADEAIAKGKLPVGLRTFVVALAGARDVPPIHVADGGGRTVLRCRPGRCVTPRGPSAKRVTTPDRGAR